MNRIIDLQSRGRPIQYDGWVTDTSLNEAYRSCDFTVYPSLREGFGLPVWESLIHGKPCVCSSSGATAETAQGGGCLTADTRSIEQLSETIGDLLNRPDLRQKLTAEATNRQPPKWSDCAQRLVDWLDELKTSKYN